MGQKLAKIEYHHGDLKSALLERCRVSVAEHGPDQVSLRGLALEIGISPSAAYHHFPDKAALMNELAEMVMTELGESLSSAFNSISGTSLLAARKRFKAIGRAYINYGVEHQNLFQLAFGPWCLHDESDREEELSWQTLMKSFAELTALGAISPSEVEAKALLAWTSVHGAAYLMADSAMLPGSIDSLIDQLERAIIKS